MNTVLVDSSHNKNRKKVCVVCYRKGKRPLSERDVEAIKEYCITDYNINDQTFPAALCNGCYLLLNKKRNGQRVIIPKVEKEVTITTTRSCYAKPCLCAICVIATCNGRSAINLKKKSGRPKSSETPESNIKICGNCFSKIYRGCSHSQLDCASRRTSQQRQIISKLSNNRAAICFKSVRREQRYAIGNLG